MIGQQFGHYDVVSRLGSGGMGVVYLARDTRLDRRVAIKVLPDGRVTDERARTRFRREAQALSRLNHPNIATIYDFDQYDGRDFLVMEYIEGESLREAGVEPLPPAEVVRLGTQLAEALAAAHSAGVVHLDLKPSNLMRTPDGRLKILDFGIARLHALDPVEDTTHTGTIADTTGTAANSAGTPPYMAPEQVAAGPVDGRTDIYGAGATLYELATGRRLFTEPRGAALYDSILRVKPDPPSGLNQSIDPPLESALLKALEKSPHKRQQDAKELLADLQRCTTSSAQPVPLPHRWRRREILLTAAAVLVAIATTGYALWPTTTGAKFNAREFVLVGDLDNRTDDPLLPRMVHEGLTMALQQSQFVNLVSQERVAETLRRMQRPPGSPLDEAAALDFSRREAIPAFISGAVTRSGDTTQITVKVLEAGSGSLLFAESAEYRKPDELFATIDDLARRVRRNLGESLDKIAIRSQPLASVTTSSADALRQYTTAVEARALGRFDEVEAPLLAALQLDAGFAMAHLKLGVFYADVTGDDGKAAHEIELAHKLSARLPDREKYFITSQFFSFHANYERCRDSLKALTALYPDDAEFRAELATAYYALEQLKEGIEELTHVTRIDPRGGRAAGNLVLFLARDNQPDAALTAYDRARARGVDSPYLNWARGLALAAKGDFAAARSAFETLGRSPGHYTQLASLQLARLALHQGDSPAAVRSLRAIVDVPQPQRDAGIELAARILMGRVALLAGDRAQARAQTAAVWKMTEKSDRPTDVRDAGSLAAAVGEPALVRAALARLSAIETSNPTPVVTSSRLALEAELAFLERRYRDALRLGDESRRLRPWHGAAIVAARASDALGVAAAARERWQVALDARGRILQDGFPPDLELARAHLARLTPR
jgi:serine/threonine protein kinase/tetratricopeptide (TPR) repeat protein